MVILFQNYNSELLSSQPLFLYFPSLQTLHHSFLSRMEDHIILKIQNVHFPIPIIACSIHQYIS